MQLLSANQCEVLFRSKDFKSVQWPEVDSSANFNYTTLKLSTLIGCFKSHDYFYQV